MPTEDKKDRNDPSNVSLAYEKMLPQWTKVSSLLGGTPAMRDAGPVYLPQHDEESDIAYQERLERNVLLNLTELTLNSWVGRPFSDPVKLNEDVPSQIVDLTTNIDLQGNNIDVVAREWFKSGLSKSFSHVLVDFPRPRDTMEEEGRPRTLEDDRAENLRPYWVTIKPEDLLFAHAVMIDGREVLTQIRIWEQVVEMDGFLEVVIPQIRIITPGTVQIYRIQKTRNGKEEWVVVDEYNFDLDFIPLVTFYSDREGFMVGKSPLSDLADLNISHWQSNADQISILTVSRFPILAGSGVDNDDNKVLIGPRKMLATTNPQGKFYYVEHTGQAISAGRENLMDLQEQMMEYGAEFLKKRPGNQTATARALDSAEATSPLQDSIVRFMDAVDLALDYMAAWLNLESGGTVEITTDFGPNETETADLNALKAARDRRDISRAKYLVELHRRGVLADDFDFEANAEEIEEERAEFSGEAGTDIDEGQGSEEDIGGDDGDDEEEDEE